MDPRDDQPAHQQAPDAHALETPAPREAVRRARILVIDDEPMVCRALQRVLSPPHDVQAQETGRGALAALFADGGYDLVLCDLMMPDLTGMDLHGQVAARAPALADRFVFLTGGAFTAAAQEFLQRVPNQRVEKPFDARALRQLVLRLLSRRGAAE